jgi:hypothetical protein
MRLPPIRSEHERDKATFSITNWHKLSKIRALPRTLHHFPVMPAQTQDNVWGFLGGILFAGFVWFYFYFRWKQGPLERLDTEVGLGVLEKQAQPGLVDGTPTNEVDHTINRIPTGRSKSSGSAGLSNGTDERSGSVNDTLTTKPQFRSNVPEESSTREGTGQVENWSEISAAGTSKLVYKQIRQRLNRDGDWTNVEEDRPDHDECEFIVLYREHARFETPRITTVVDVKDQYLKQALKWSLPPEHAIFDEDELVSNISLYFLIQGRCQPSHQPTRGLKKGSEEPRSGRRCKREVREFSQVSIGWI